VTSFREIAVELEQLLKLRKPIVAISFRRGSAEGLGESRDSVPSSCTFWTLALSAAFKTSREQHMNCTIGAVTHGFKNPKEVGPGCGCSDVDFLLDAGWISADDIHSLPSVPPGHEGVSYGPLRSVDFEPDVVLIFCNPEQAMFIASASPYKVLGKPTCTGIPVALLEKVTVISLGCTASRLRAGYKPDELVVFMPGSILPSIAEILKRVVEADEKVAIAVLEGKA